MLTSLAPGGAIWGIPVGCALGLTQFQLSAACGDETMRLPPDFTVPPCD